MPRKRLLPTIALGVCSLAHTGLLFEIFDRVAGFVSAQIASHAAISVRGFRMIDARSNHLLAALPADKWQRWLPLPEPAEMPLGTGSYEPGQVLTHVHFPTTTIVSLLYVMENGASAEDRHRRQRGGRRHLVVHGWRKHAESSGGAKYRSWL